MSNTLTKARLYSPSAIGEILKIARERASQEEHRTKQYLAGQLGITVARLTNIEKGYSVPPFELAADWCQAVGDYTALKKIKHIFGMSLPPTDPWLLQSVPDQLSNFIKQAQGAIEAAEALLQMSHQRRPRSGFTEMDKADMLAYAEEILDVHQSADCVIASMRQNWELEYETLLKNWIQEALADRVIIPSVSEFEAIRKEEFFAERARNMRGVYQ